MINSNNKIAILGAGNLGCAIAKGFVNAQFCKPEDIILTRRNTTKLKKYQDEGFAVTSDNEKAVKDAKFIFLCVQPRQLAGLISEINAVLSENRHVLVSTITGVEMETIEKYLQGNFPIIRAMPNTATIISESMTCICANKAGNEAIEEIEHLFKALGDTLIIEESMMKAATVLAASGIAFFLRYIRAATQGGIQLGFDASEAQKIAVQTARGAASLLIGNGAHPETEIDKVTTPKGCTISGLNEMEHQGLSSALIKGIIKSYEKISTITE